LSKPSEKILLELVDEIKLRVTEAVTINATPQGAAPALLSSAIFRGVKTVLAKHPEVDAERTHAGDPQLHERLEKAVKTLEMLVSSYGEVTANKMLSEEITVRSQGRTTLSMFESGTRLRVKELRRKDGSLGGVELIIKQ
jgi:hypothetical protein